MNLSIRDRSSSLFSGRPTVLIDPFRSLFRYSSAFNSGAYRGKKNNSIRSLCSATQSSTAFASWARRRSTIRNTFRVVSRSNPSKKVMNSAAVIVSL